MADLAYKERNMKKKLILAFSLLYLMVLAPWAFAEMSPFSPVASEPLIMFFEGAGLILFARLRAKHDK